MPEYQVALLEPMISKGEAVLDERKDAELDRVEGRIEIDNWKEEVNAVRTGVYAQLIGLAAKTKRKRAWAETFFPSTTARSSRGDDDEAADGDEVIIDGAEE